MPRRYPLGIQTFQKIIEENMLYVDKTELIYKLTQSYSYVFLSRPRRFGKSLLVSTLASYFRGEKDLFKGLAIERLEKQWKKLGEGDRAGEDSFIVKRLIGRAGKVLWDSFCIRHLRRSIKKSDYIML